MNSKQMLRFDIGILLTVVILIPTSYFIFTDNQLSLDNRNGISNPNNNINQNNDSIIDTLSNNQTINLDPIVNASVLFGGEKQDRGSKVAVDNQDNIYMVGITYSMDFPRKGSFPSVNTSIANFFLTKYDVNLDLQWSRILGGIGLSYTGLPLTLEINSSESSIYVAGTTSSDGFPMVNPIDDKFEGDSEGFLMKLNSSGYIKFSTFLGGINDDGIYDLDINDNGLIVFGKTNSPNIQYLEGVGQTQHQQSFLMNFDSNGTMQWGKYLEENKNEQLTILESLSNSNMILAGRNYTSDAMYEALIQLTDKYGNVTNSYQFGGNSIDQIYNVVIDEEDNIYLGGQTQSINFPTINAYDNSYNGNVDGFFMRLDSSLSVLWSTYFGGSESMTSNPYGMDIDSNGNLGFVFGANDKDLPLINAISNYSSIDNGLHYYGKFNPSGVLITGTYTGRYFLARITMVYNSIDQLIVTGSYSIEEFYDQKLSQIELFIINPIENIRLITYDYTINLEDTDKDGFADIYFQELTLIPNFSHESVLLIVELTINGEVMTNITHYDFTDSQEETDIYEFLGGPKSVYLQTYLEFDAVVPLFEYQFNIYPLGYEITGNQSMNSSSTDIRTTSGEKTSSDAKLSFPIFSLVLFFFTVSVYRVKRFNHI